MTSSNYSSYRKTKSIIIVVIIFIIVVFLIIGALISISLAFFSKTTKISDFITYKNVDDFVTFSTDKKIYNRASGTIDLKSILKLTEKSNAVKFNGLSYKGNIFT